ncbi:MAG: hypothetical protein D6767_00480 [Candidatus Hydrogenedentota bacterium]|nr:MAG: hypothetical protein D6767_00480 [Candidatus Hydrogenedentota bacterium]
MEKLAKDTYMVSTSRGIYQLNWNGQQAKWQLLYSSKTFWPDKDTNLSIRLVGVLDKRTGKPLGFVMNHNPVLSEQKKVRMQKAKSKKLFYSSAYNYKHKQYQVDSLLQKNIFDGMVLDVKDDFGYLRYKSQVPFAKKIKSIRPFVSLKQIVKKVKKWNKYLVVRLVVFKDPVLFRQSGYPIINKQTGKPWIGLPKERWIDPYREDLADNYYIPLMKELQSLGVDEIQLDYIRFPSDGDISKTKYTHRKNSLQNLTDALENFLAKLRPHIQVPLSMDIYGYNGLYRAPGRIGQDIDVYLKFADVLCPMVYSSHFGDYYLTDVPREKRAYRLLRHSALRSLHLASGKAIIRPYLQAFPMKNSIWGYGKKYFLDQVLASKEMGIDGYTFWGAFKHILRVANDLKSIQ